MNIQLKKDRLLATSLIAGLAIGGFADVAAAQTSSSEDIVVTGSRIARRDYVADSPIVTVGVQQLEQTGSSTVETLINQLPQFTPAITSTSNNPGNGGQANISLRGLGTNRTLVLVDGHRIVPANTNGTVDVNAVPTALIENIEVVTGGQSAVYGSDAIAGAVNFKLNHHFEGVKVDAQYGETSRSDGEEDNVAVTMGSNFADDKGNAVLSVSYANREPIFNAKRAFSKVSGPSGTTPYGQFDNSGTNSASLAAANALFVTKYGGTVPLTSVPNFGFNPNGSLFTSGANAKHYLGSTATGDFATIPTLGTYNTGPLNELTIPLQRYTAYGRAEYEFNPHLHASTDINFVNYTSNVILAPSPAANNPGSPNFPPGSGGTGFLVPATNPFIPADLATLLASRPTPGAPFLFRDRFTAIGPRLSADEYYLYQIDLDVGGDLTSDITWDVFASYGKDQRTELQFGNVSHQAVRTLLEAADGGTSLCTGGLNLFGLQPISPSCQAFVSRNTKNQTEYTQRNVEFNIAGGAFDLPAGKVKFAAGLDYRSDQVVFSPDSVLSTSDISRVPGDPLYNNAPGVVGFNAQGAIKGFIDTKEAYGELLIPVLANLPLIEEFNVDLAYRYSDYNTVGGVETYKADADWKAFDFLSFRGGYSRAVRAPSLFDLFQPNANNFPAIGAASPTKVGSGDPCDSGGNTRATAGANAAAIQALCIAQGVPAATYPSYTFPNTQGQAVVGGNPNLKQEIADTYTVGFVLAPKLSMPLFERLSLSVDYYDIQIAGYISAPDEPTFLQRCFNPAFNPTFTNTNPFCANIGRDPTSGQLSGFLSTSQNLSQLSTKGEDIQFDWGFGLGAVGLDDKFGHLTFNTVITHLDSFNISALPGDPPTNFAGTIGNTFVSSVEVSHPKWKTLTSFAYDFSRFQIGVRWRYIDKMMDANSSSVHIPAYNYWDLTAKVDLTDSLEIRGGVLNITDKQPPIQDAPLVQANTDPSTYDVLGKRFFVALTAKF